MAEKFLNQELFLELEDISFGKGNQLMFENFSWKIKRNESWAIVGGSGSGKSLLARAILGELFISKGRIVYHFPKHSISYLSFSEESKVFNYSNYYYQQRFNATESEGSITTQEYLEAEVIPSDLLSLFNLQELLSQKFIKLSNGQTRKARIVKALLKKPRLLILDEPFIGLDASSRIHLKGVLDKLQDLGTACILISSTLELPNSITHVLEIENCNVKQAGEKESILNSVVIAAPSFPTFDNTLLTTHNELLDFAIAVQFNNVNISYDDKKILKNINWTIKKGEKWALLGPNGAGKTTLLSLVNADNPQSYSQDLILFDRQRGSGESIWDIKKRIGFLSPELHYYFKSDMTCGEVVATGFLETLFLNRTLSDAERFKVEFLFRFFALEQLKETSFLTISTGQQKLMLFLRAVIKNPSLMILDEPFQGMDFKWIEKCQELLNYYLTPSNTLIFVTHNTDEIPQIVKKVFYLEDGRGTIKSLEVM